MRRFLSIAVVALLAGTAARAQTHPLSNLTLSDPPRESQYFAGDGAPAGIEAGPPAVHAAPEFHAAGAIAALTLLLCGVAVLKGWRRE